MDESRVTALMVEATDEVAGQRFDPEDDLRRGRAAQRRRSTKVTAAAVLGTAAAVVVALALAGQLAWRPDVQVAGGPEHTATTAPTRLDTAAVTSTTVSPQTTSAAAPAPGTATPLPGMPGMPGMPAGVAEFNRLLFAVAQDHVDPDHTRLEWTEGFTGSSGGNVKEWGRKFGWQAPGESGQAMLYLGVGNIPAADRLGCGQYDYQGTRKCTTATLPNGQPAVEMSSPTRLEVHWSRPDGTYVFVIVDAVFGNNTTVASKAPLPTLAQLEQLVIDPRLVLPS